MDAWTSWWLPLLVLVGLVVLFTSFYVQDRRIARDLASRPLREFQVAGLDRDALVSRHATWGPLPILTRRERRRLDEARAKIERWEAQQRQERGPGDRSG